MSRTSFAASFFLAIVIALSCAVSIVASPAEAQRRPIAPPPAVLSITPEGEGHRVIVTVEAREALELAADRRFLRVEIRDARGRRATCASSVRPRPGARTRQLAAGERWSEWLDLRELCWGRSLAALHGARTVTFHFDAGRARGAWVVRTPRGATRALEPILSTWRPPAPPVTPAGDVVVSLAASDAVRGGRPTLRLRVVGGSSTPRRAYVREESVSFRVLTPSGGAITCGLRPFEGRALPDFFSRLSTRGARVFALDGSAYCGRFEEPGIYEITPVITLTESGDEWRLRAVTGTFVGNSAPLRIRSTTYVEQPAAGSR